MAKARKQITHIDGVAIIERQPALAPHPNPGQGGRLVETTGVEYVLLEDGRETNMCIECGYTNDNPRSVVAHMSGQHSLTRPPSLYPDDIMRTIIREVLRAKQTGARNFMEIAASALNDMGVQAVQTGDGRFTSSAVSRLYAAHHDRFSNVRVRTKAEPRPTLTEAEVAVVAERREQVEEGAAQALGKVEQMKADMRARTDAMEIVDPSLLTGPEKALVNNRVRRIERMAREFMSELSFLDRYVSELEAKAKAYEKLKDAFRQA